MRCHLTSISGGASIREIGGFETVDTSKSALDLLEQLRHERDELDTLIKGLEKRLGILSDVRCGREAFETESRPSACDKGNLGRISQERHASQPKEWTDDSLYDIETQSSV